MDNINEYFNIITNISSILSAGFKVSNVEYSISYSSTIFIDFFGNQSKQTTKECKLLIIME
jgi:hypothetical protein